MAAGFVLATDDTFHTLNKQDMLKATKVLVSLSVVDKQAKKTPKIRAKTFRHNELNKANNTESHMDG